MSNVDEDQAQVRTRCRSREVSSRYMLPTISSAAATHASNDASPRARRSSSPNSRSSRLRLDGSETPVRSQSVERRRPEKDNRLRGSAALWPSTALNNDLPTLGDQLGLKKKMQTDMPSNSNGLRNDNNNRARRSVEPWKENIHSGPLTSILNRSLDSTTRGKAVGRSSSLNLPGRSFRNNDIKLSGLISPGRLSVDLGKHVTRRAYDDAEDSNSNSIVSDCNGTGNNLVPVPTSEGEGEREGENGNKTSKKIIKGSYVPARFLQDTLSRLRRMSEAGLVPKNNYRGGSGSKGFQSCGMSPGRDNLNMASTAKHSDQFDPAKTGSRVSSVLNLGMEMLKGKGKGKAKSKVLKAVAHEEVLHQLRLLHNRCLQWRFVNARAQIAHQTQTAWAQNSIYWVWLKTSELRSRVVIKRIHFNRARHQHKVNTVVAAHAAHLEDWTGLKEDHDWAVRRTMECLDAATIRVPLVAGAKADVRAVKQVVSFAVDVMHGIHANATKFLPQAEKVDALLPELAETITRERALLQECVELLAGLNSLEVEERSLKTHLVQLHRQMLCVQ